MTIPDYDTDVYAWALAQMLAEEWNSRTWST
jgi:hypothetical protein